MNMDRIILFILIWDAYRNTQFVVMGTHMHVLIFPEYRLLPALLGKSSETRKFLLNKYFICFMSFYLDLPLYKHNV